MNHTLPTATGRTEMTESELQSEWRYRYHERIGILCGTAEPTEQQKLIARIEATNAVNALRKAGDAPCPTVTATEPKECPSGG